MIMLKRKSHYGINIYAHVTFFFALYYCILVLMYLQHIQCLLFSVTHPPPSLLIKKN